MIDFPSQTVRLYFFSLNQSSHFLLHSSGWMMTACRKSRQGVKNLSSEVSMPDNPTHPSPHPLTPHRQCNRTQSLPISGEWGGGRAGDGAATPHEGVGAAHVSSSSSGLPRHRCRRLRAPHPPPRQYSHRRSFQSKSCCLSCCALPFQRLSFTTP